MKLRDRAAVAGAISLIAASAIQSAHAAERNDVVAGTGQKGLSGDGGPAMQAMLNLPQGVVAAPGGYLFIADTDNGAIRRVGPDGLITPVGAASGPTGMAIDAAGNLYVAEHAGHRVLQIRPDGGVERFAGTGVPGYSGDGGRADRAQINWPSALAVDPEGGLYIADTANHRVRYVDSTGVIHTVAGTGLPQSGGDGGPAVNSQLHSPYGLALDRAGNLYISEWEGNRIRRIDRAGVITTYAGTGAAGFAREGSASAARLNGPRGLAIDWDGSLVVAEHWNNHIRKISRQGVISTVLGDDGSLHGPSDVCLDGAGNLYAADSWNHRIVKLGGKMSGGILAGSPFPQRLAGPIAGDVLPAAVLMSVAHDYEGYVQGLPGVLCEPGGARSTITFEGLGDAPLDKYDALIVPHTGSYYLPYQPAELAKIDDFVRKQGGGLVLVGSASKWDGDAARRRDGRFPINSLSEPFGIRFTSDGEPGARTGVGASGSISAVPVWAKSIGAGLRSRVDALVLSTARPEFVVRDAEGHIVLAGLTAGAGRVLAMATVPNDLMESAQKHRDLRAALTGALNWVRAGRIRHAFSPTASRILPGRVTRVDKFTVYSSLLVPDANAEEMAQAVADTCRAVRGCLGIDWRDSLKDVHVILVQTIGGNMGGDEMQIGIRDGRYQTCKDAAHELGHEWDAPGAMPGGFHEGWAEYVSCLARKRLGFEVESAASLKAYIDSVRREDPNLNRIDLTTADANSGGAIAKAVYVLASLSDHYGPDFTPRFIRVYREYVTAHEGLCPMRTFVGLLSRAAGGDLSSWFRSLNTSGL